MDSSGSLLDLIRMAIPSAADLLQGDVISDDPLKVQIKGDDKLILTKESLVVPWHLTDYVTKITIKAYDSDGTINGATVTKGGSPHSHAGCYSGSTGTESAHTHHQDVFQLDKAYVKMHNHLRKGDVLHLIALQAGKLYYILDRVQDPPED